MAARNRTDTDTVRRPAGTGSSRKRRRLERYRGMLRCEWCGRMAAVDSLQNWSRLPLSEWSRYANSHPVWFCSRPRCVANRAELSLPGDNGGRPDYDDEDD